MFGLASEDGEQRLADHRVAVGGEHDLQLGQQPRDLDQRVGDPPHRLTPGLPAVGGDQQDRPAVPFDRLQAGIGERPVPRHRPQQRVDDRVPGDDDRAAGHVLPQQVVPADRGGDEMERGEPPGEPTVHLLRIRGVDVVGAQAGLQVGHRHLRVEGRQGCGEGRGRVALHQHHVRSLLSDQPRDPVEGAPGDVVQRLAGLHDLEVVVRPDVEVDVDLLQHRLVLSGEHHDRRQQRRPLELANHRRHLDRLRAGAVDQHHPLGRGRPARPRVLDRRSIRGHLGHRWSSFRWAGVVSRWVRWYQAIHSSVAAWAAAARCASASRRAALDVGVPVRPDVTASSAAATAGGWRCGSGDAAGAVGLDQPIGLDPAPAAGEQPPRGLEPGGHPQQPVEHEDVAEGDTAQPAHSGDRAVGGGEEEHREERQQVPGDQLVETDDTDLESPDRGHARSARPERTGSSGTRRRSGPGSGACATCPDAYAPRSFGRPAGSAANTAAGPGTIGSAGGPAAAGWSDPCWCTSARLL